MLALPADADAPLGYLDSGGSKADTVLPLTWGLIAISVAVVVVIGLLLVAAIWRRSGSVVGTPGLKREVLPGKGGIRWIWIGVGASTLVLTASVVWTVGVLADIADPPAPAAFTVEVTGHQWWWEVRYLSSDPSRIFTTANEIHIPAGVPVRFELKSGDVIHSFWVPKLSGKTDLIPGQTNELWLEAKDAGVYRGQCAEYCGIEHAHMALVVVAQAPDLFETWWNAQLQPASQTADSAGMTAFDTHCGSCHAVRGTDAGGTLGPDLSHLMERRTIGAGLLANTDANRRRWISDPQGLKPGNLMQKPELSDPELAAIGGYLKTLR